MKFAEAIFAGSAAVFWAMSTMVGWNPPTGTLEAISNELIQLARWNTLGAAFSCAAAVIHFAVSSHEGSRPSP